MSSSESESDEEYIPEAAVSDEDEVSEDEAPEGDRKRPNAELAASEAKKAKRGEGQGANAEVEEEEKKRRVDDLWSSFKKDVGETATTTRPVPSEAPETKDKTGKTSRFSDFSRSKEKAVTTKTYDFAGEKVVVKDVVETDVNPSQKERRSGSSLSNLLKGLGKAPKLSTLDKSKLDWKTYTVKEGLKDELSQHNKDGYLERRAFLERTDVRQYELEKEIRLKKLGKRIV
eukprot:m.14757 g.14757  ORF g.14757 m.14757 type:complete len:230 (+) comp25963_c0_seq2:2-691(+)